MKKTILAIALVTLYGSVMASDMNIGLPAQTTAASLSPEAKPATVSATPVAPFTATVKAPPAPVAGVTQRPMTITAPVASLPLTIKASAPIVAPASKPSLSANIDSGAAAPVVMREEVNPFTGDSLTTEAIHLKLDHAKAETQLLEEELKQATLTADIDNLPAKKRAEMAQLKGIDLITPTSGVASSTSTPVPAKTPLRPKKKVADKPVAKVELVEAPKPHLPVVTLDGVIVSGGYSSAILNIDGNTSIVSTGTMSQLGQVTVLNETSVRVGTTVLQLHDNTIARLKISDPKPIDPKLAAAASQSAARALAPAPTMARNLNLPLPPIPGMQ